MPSDLSDEALKNGSLERFLTYRLARVQAKLNAQASRILRDHAGLTLTQWRLIALIGFTVQTNAAALSRTATMDKGLISRNIRTLGQDGLVRIIPDENDHRAQTLQLTSKGKAIFEKTLPRMRQRQQALRSLLTDEEEQALSSALEKLEAATDDRSLG